MSEAIRARAAHPPQCINLRERYGANFRITYDQAHKGRQDNAWMQVIAGEYGHIYPHGGELLAVATNSRRLVRQLTAIAGVVIVQDGDDGVNATFPVESFDDVAQLMRLRRKRRSHRPDLAA